LSTCVCAGLLVLGVSARPAANASITINLSPISTDFNNPIGIDFHEPTNKVLLSSNYSSGEPHNFDLVASDGSHSQFSSLHGLTDEVYIATVRSSACHPGFLVGESFTGNGQPGQIVRISPDGSTVQNPWVTLPGETGLLHGGLFQDRFCSWGGDLIVTTNAADVWRVTGTGAATLVGHDQSASWLEGPTTIPDDPVRYGPWSGTIVAADERSGCVWSIDHSGNFTCFPTLAMGGDPESVRIIEPNQNFFGVDFGDHTLMGAEAAQFAGIVGDVLLADEHAGLLIHIHWNGTGFETEEVARVAQWEGTTFAPAGIPPIPPPRPPNVDVSDLSGPQGETTIAASLTDPRSLVAGATGATVYSYATTDGGKSWITADVAASAPVAGCARGLAGDPSVTASAKDNSYYYAFLSTCKDHKGSELDVVSSPDGLQWSKPVAVYPRGIGKDFMNKVFDVFNDKPTITVDNSPSSLTYGRIYVAWIADNDDRLALAWSDNKGATWSLPVTVDTGSCDFAPSVAVDLNGAVGVTWFDYTSGRIRVAFDIFFLQPRAFPFANAVSFLGFPRPVFGSSQALGDPGMGSDARLTRGCLNVSPNPIHFPINAQPGRGIQPDPSLLIDNNPARRPRYYALWTQMDTGFCRAIVSVSNIMLSTSTDGVNWSPPTQVNHDNNNPSQWGSSNFFGQAALDQNTGALHVSFYSTRLDQSGKSVPFCSLPIGYLCNINCQTDVFHTVGTVSSNGGVSFSPDLRVTDKSSDESDNNKLNRCSDCFQYGDYEGIAVDQGGVAHPVWTDARFADGASRCPDVGGSTNLCNEEVFTAAVR